MWNIQGIVNRGDYLNAIIPEHPNATVHGYVLLHRAVMENHLGRLLTSDEIVHHLDHNTFNNDIHNLQVMTRAEHSRLHGLEQGQRMVVMCCPQCGCYFDLRKNNSSLVVKSKPYNFCSRQCSGAFYSYLRYYGVIELDMEERLANNYVFEYTQYNC